MRTQDIPVKEKPPSALSATGRDYAYAVDMPRRWPAQLDGCS
jgi:hypothetical protein